MYSILEFFKYLAQSNTINFFLMVWFLVWVCSKLHLGTSFDKSVENVAASINKSDEEKKKSKVILNDMEQEMTKLPQVLQKIKKDSSLKENVLKKQIEDSTQKSISNIEQNVSKVLKAEEKQISDEIIDDAVEKAISQAKDDIINLLKSNPDLHSKFIEESLVDFDKVKL